MAALLLAPASFQNPFLLFLFHHYHSSYQPPTPCSTSPRASCSHGPSARHRIPSFTISPATKQAEQAEKVSIHLDAVAAPVAPKTLREQSRSKAPPLSNSSAFCPPRPLSTVLGLLASACHPMPRPVAWLSPGKFDNLAQPVSRNREQNRGL